MSTLHHVWVSKASAIQRKGRWGVRVIVIKHAVVRAKNSRNSVRDRYCVLRPAYWSKLLRKLFQCYCLFSVRTNRCDLEQRNLLRDSVVCASSKWETSFSTHGGTTLSKELHEFVVLVVSLRFKLLLLRLHSLLSYTVLAIVKDSILG